MGNTIRQMTTPSKEHSEEGKSEQVQLWTNMENAASAKVKGKTQQMTNLTMDKSESSWETFKNIEL